MKPSRRNTTLHLGAALIVTAFALPALAQTGGATGATGGTSATGAPAAGGMAPGSPSSGATTGDTTGSGPLGSGPRDARDIGSPPRDARDINGTGVQIYRPADRAGSGALDSSGSVGGAGAASPGARSDALDPDNDRRGTRGAMSNMDRRGDIDARMDEDERRMDAEQRRRMLERQGGTMTPGSGLYR